jgi:hypothetical protein
MALPERISHMESSRPNYEAGGPVAAMQQSVQAQLLPAQTILPEWTNYVDARSPTEDAIHNLSRFMGVLAMTAGIAAALTMVVRLA